MAALSTHPLQTCCNDSHESFHLGWPGTYPKGPRIGSDPDSILMNRIHLGSPGIYLKGPRIGPDSALPLLYPYSLMYLVAPRPRTRDMRNCIEFLATDHGDDAYDYDDDASDHGDDACDHGDDAYDYRVQSPHALPYASEWIPTAFGPIVLPVPLHLQLDT
ncbi:uncharacterized protein BDR25DRAFT_351146 [Lindgomyces ingoldianus]|uniref:Uncharacterized protein n=1 Tax=Lindgomyces ingoldianus TaxID=673940 RepID=A0ACB6R612_9PLEO|nr:uncharacterized protein BDR25DRAFT_351146 [Lindgomyces ingoldianus]KAF2474616.1 hypothetical protein BDR25DRAFT_351146 [Lindgomyces ingoldianus]